MHFNRIASLKQDYPRYITKCQGLFVMRCQMMSREFDQISATVNISKLHSDLPNFKRLRKDIEQDGICKGQTTLVIDIENTIVTQVELKSRLELDDLKQMEDFN
jgi:hypothetical protein